MATDEDLYKNGYYVFPRYQGGNDGGNNGNSVLYSTIPSEWDKSKHYEINDLVVYKDNLYRASKFVYLNSADGVDPISARTEIYGREFRVWHCIGSPNHYLKLYKLYNKSGVWYNPLKTTQVDTGYGYGNYPDGSPITQFPTIDGLTTYYGSLSSFLDSNLRDKINSPSARLEARCVYTSEGLAENNIDFGGKYDKPYETRASICQRYNAESPYKYTPEDDMIKMPNNTWDVNPKYSPRSRVYDEETGSYSFKGSSAVSLGRSEDMFYNYKEGSFTNTTDPVLLGQTFTYQKLKKEDTYIIYGTNEHWNSNIFLNNFFQYTLGEAVQNGQTFYNNPRWDYQTDPEWAYSPINIFFWTTTPWYIGNKYSIKCEILETYDEWNWVNVPDLSPWYGHWVGTVKYIIHDLSFDYVMKNNDYRNHYYSLNTQNRDAFSQLHPFQWIEKNGNYIAKRDIWYYTPDNVKKILNLQNGYQVPEHPTPWDGLTPPPKPQVSHSFNIRKLFIEKVK